MAESRPARRGIAILKLAITALLCYLILRSVDFTTFVDTIRGVKPGYLALPCLLYPLGLGIAALKLKWLLGGYQLKITGRDAFDVNWIGAFFNNFLPSSIGGDVYRLVYLNRSFPDKPAQIVSAIIIDRGLGLLALLVITGLIAPFFLPELVASTWAIAALYSALALAALSGFLVLFVPHGIQIPYKTRWHIANRIINGVNILIGFPDKTALTRSLLVSFLSLILTVVSHYFLFLAFESKITLLLLLFVIPVVTLAAMIPISINALGVIEGTGILLLSHFGFEPELVLSIFLTNRILWILCSATGGLRLLFRRNLV